MCGPNDDVSKGHSAPRAGVRGRKARAIPTLRIAQRRRATVVAPPPLQNLPAPSAIREILAVAGRPGVISLAGGMPDLSLLDRGWFERGVAAALAVPGLAGPAALQYAPTEGVAQLRAVLAARFAVAESQVLVTTGAQQAIDLVARALAGPGATVAIEDPAYPGASLAYRCAGARLIGIGGDARGLEPGGLARLVEAGLRPSVVHVVPTVANPTGTTLDADRRQTLAALADRCGAWLVEDDPYAELAAPGTGAPSAMTWSDRVLRIGSASKVLAPGLRVGWLIGPRDVVARAAIVKQAADLHTSALDQLIVAHLLGDDDGRRAHLASVRAELRSRARTLVGACHQHLDGRMGVTDPGGGMFVWARLLDGATGAEVAANAARADVAVVPGEAFRVGPTGHEDRLRLSFATATPSTIEEAVRRLAASWP